MPKVVTLTMNPALDMVVEMASLLPEEVNKARRAETFCGGKGINVSLVLSFLGIPSSACGVLGQDNAALFEKFCRERGIDFQFELAPGATRTNVKLAVDGRGATDINLPGLTPPPSILDALRYRLDKLVENGDIVVLSGSLPPGVADDLYASLIIQLRFKGAVTFLDASGEALANGLAAGPNLAKPNREELRALDGGAAGGDKNEYLVSIADSAERWLERGVG
ncbi:MAG: PfkB family carbohydrate kinase, partial [Planctomycetes bacterium]|nr:PfkB family carbohydrate kinase [Planctomycetota bacterium]